MLMVVRTIEYFVPFNDNESDKFGKLEKVKFGVIVYLCDGNIEHVFFLTLTFIN